MSDREEQFRERLRKKGIIHFGPIEKHYLKDPSRGYPPKAVPHTPRQQGHGRRPGKRSMMTGLRALANRDKGLDIPTWNRMLEMSHSDVLSLFERHYGEVKPGKGDVVRVVDNKPGDDKGAFRRKEEKVDEDAKAVPAGGKQGKNLKVDEFPVTEMQRNKKPKEKEREQQTPKTRLPGRDVADVRERGFMDERERGNQAGRPKGQRGKGDYRNPESEAQQPRPDGDNTRASRRRMDDRRARNLQDEGRARRENRIDEMKRRDRLIRRRAREERDRKAKIPEVQQVKDLLQNEANLGSKVKDVMRGLNNMSDPADVAGPLNGIARGARSNPNVPKEVADKIDRLARKVRQRVPNSQPDGPRTARAREAAPETDANMKDIDTAAQVDAQDFKQDLREVEAAKKAGEDEVARAKKEGRKPNRLRVAGRIIDEIAFKDRAANKEPSRAQAQDRANMAFEQLGRRHDLAVSPAEADKWREALVERYMLRHNGSPQNEAEEKRARQIVREEQQRNDEGNWERRGRVRDKVRRPAKGEPAREAEREKMPSVVREALEAPGRLARDPQAVAEVEARLKEESISDVKDLDVATEDDGRGIAQGVRSEFMKVGKQGDKRVFLKNKRGDGYQEVLGFEVGRQLGIDEFLPVAVDRDDGAAIEAVGNAVGSEEGVNGWDAIVDAIERKYKNQGAESGDARKMATEAAKRLFVFDAVIANDDRHGKNVRINVNENGEVDNYWLIDHGLMGRGGTNNPAIVKLRQSSWPSMDVEGVEQSDPYNYRMRLSPELREMLEKLDDNWFEQHRNLFEKLEFGVEGQYGDLIGAYHAKHATMEAMKARVQAFLDNNYIEYRW